MTKELDREYAEISAARRSSGKVVAINMMTLSKPCTSVPVGGECPKEADEIFSVQNEGNLCALLY
jgi:hypothetical protein